ncbi:MAG TPA: DUF4145 domain-containing protein [Longimicrobiales bacterium]|nr:DUF4145 domain-containing protein [Longimicrobiales bacterium]
MAVEGLPEDVAEAYDEARACFGVGGFTGCELVCRKILMHVAVEKGAKEGEPFQAYIDYLADQRYVTPPMRPWVDRIRAHGNLATHRLAKPEKARAESTLMFTGELLRLVYEMDYMSKLYAPPEPAESGGEPEDAAE